VNIQDAVHAYSAKTTFALSPGIYREASVTSLKDGDSFIGEPGAVMDGAKLLTDWTPVSIGGQDYWTAAGGTPLESPRCAARGSCCLAEYPGCVYVQDLYVDSAEYRHVVALREVRSGTWYYDFDGADGGRLNNIYLAAPDDPNSHVVELGHAVYAFAGHASNITVKNLTVEKYATPIQSAAIQPAGPNWTVEGNDVRLNHAFGIKAKTGGDNIRVLRNKVHHNGEMGVGAGGAADGTWDSNEIAYNNSNRVNPGFEGGGSKFVGDRIRISNNVVHDNYGPGLWTDEGGTYNTYEHNISYNNFGGGIRYEISRYGVIKYNTVYGNTRNPQIVYTGSDHGRIIGNLVVDDGSGGIFVQNIVGTRPRETIYKLTDTQVTGNTIVFGPETSTAAGVLDFSRPPQPEVFRDPSNIFDHNIYKFQGQSRFGAALLSQAAWCWGENPGGGPRRITWPTWQNAGQDRSGSFVSVSAKTYMYKSESAHHF
jgi:parallel beta-helix repeat protein